MTKHSKREVVTEGGGADCRRDKISYHDGERGVSPEFGLSVEGKESGGRGLFSTFRVSTEQSTGSGPTPSAGERLEQW